MKRTQKRALTAVRRWTNRANAAQSFSTGWDAISNATRIGKRAKVSLHRTLYQLHRIKSITLSVGRPAEVEYEEGGEA